MLITPIFLTVFTTLVYSDSNEAHLPPPTYINVSAIWESTSSCQNLNASPFVVRGYKNAIDAENNLCAEFWCFYVKSSEIVFREAVPYYLVKFGHISSVQEECFFNITKMVVLHHSWPMCGSEFICATNHTSFDLSPLECMPTECIIGEIMVLIFMALTTFLVSVLALIIIIVICKLPEFHKPKYYLRLALSVSDILIGTMVTGNAAYNQLISLIEVPGKNFFQYPNLSKNQLLRYIPNCLRGTSHIMTQISGIIATACAVSSLYLLAFLALDRMLLLTCTNYKNLMTSARVGAAILFSACSGALLSAIQFAYIPVKQLEICVNCNLSSYDVHIINSENKIATIDYRIYLPKVILFCVHLTIVFVPVSCMLIFSFRTLRKYAAWTKNRDAMQVSEALRTSQRYKCSYNTNEQENNSHPYNCAYYARTFSAKTGNPNGIYSVCGLSVHISRDFSSDTAEKLRRSHSYEEHSMKSIMPDQELYKYSVVSRDDESEMNYRCCISYSQQRKTREEIYAKTFGRNFAAERDREITRTVLVNVFFFVLACFPLLAVGLWMIYLFFTDQSTLNNPPPLKQLLFIGPWLMLLNSFWNSALHFIYNNKFRLATKLFFTQVFCRMNCSK